MDQDMTNKSDFNPNVPNDDELASLTKGQRDLLKRGKRLFFRELGAITPAQLNDGEEERIRLLRPMPAYSEITNVIGQTSEDDNLDKAQFDGPVRDHSTPRVLRHNHRRQECVKKGKVLGRDIHRV